MLEKIQLSLNYFSIFPLSPYCESLGREVNVSFFYNILYFNNFRCCANRRFLDAKYLVAANRRMQMIGDIYYRRWCSMRSRESEKASKLTGRNAHSPWLRRTPAAAVVALCALEECTDGILGADGRDIAHSSAIQVQVIFIVFSHSWSAVETHGLPIRRPQLAIDRRMNDQC